MTARKSQPLPSSWNSIAARPSNVDSNIHFRTPLPGSEINPPGPTIKVVLPISIIAPPPTPWKAKTKQATHALPGSGNANLDLILEPGKLVLRQVHPQPSRVASRVHGLLTVKRDLTGCNLFFFLLLLRYVAHFAAKPTASCIGN